MKIYKRGKKKLIFCRNRKVLLKATPEEQVRQNVLAFLIDEMNVPEEFIDTEYLLTRMDPTSNLRADIVVWESDEYGKKIPFLVIELKARHIQLTDETIAQVQKYNAILHARYFAISNGEVTKIYEVTGNNIHLLTNDLYTYADLIHGDIEYEIEIPMRRLTYNLVTYPKYVRFLMENSYIGEGTPEYLHPIIAELQNYLLCGEVIPQQRFSHKIIEDYSYGKFTVGNASGGRFPGYYRSFLVKSSQSNHQIFSIAIYGTASLQNDSVYGNRKGNTYLIVAVEESGVSKSILQLNLDQYLVSDPTNQSLNLIHNGRRNDFKNEQVMRKVLQHEPTLIKGNTIFLGSLPSDKSIGVEGGSEMVERILAYAACREKLKKVKRRRRVRK